MSAQIFYLKLIILLFELLLIIDQAITKRVDEIKDTLDDHVSYGNVGVIEWLVSSNRETKKLFNKKKTPGFN